MRRLGIYTGKIYEDGYDKNNIKECCLTITDGMDIEKAKNDNKHRCDGCFCCEEAGMRRN